MSNENQKADQIAFHVYTKLTHVVNHARTTTDQRGQPKPDKWFNLETPDSDFFSKEDREPYRALSSYIHPTLPPPLEIQVLLTIPELASNQVLVHLDPDTNTRHRIEPTPRFILLESFILDFAHHGSTSSFSSSSSSTGVADIAPSTMYKHGIPLFRSLYTMLRVMPAWKVFKRLKRRIGRFGGGNMGIVVRLKEPGDDTLEFGTPLASQSHLLPSHILPTQSHTFVPVPHPHGTITLSLQYLTTPTFQIDDKESLFSSGFLAGDKAQSQQQRFGQSPPHVPATTTTPMVSRQPPPPPPDPDVEFVPTLIKNQQRDSIASSAGLGYGTSSSPNHGRSNLSGLSREVTTQSIADRFILPPTQPQQSGVGSPGTAGAAMTQSRTAPASSMPGSGGFRTIPLPGSTGLGASTGAGAGSISGVGSGSGAGAGVGSNVGMGGMGSSGSFTGVGLLGGNRSRTNSPRTSPRKSLINLPGTVPLGVGNPSSSSSSSPLHGHGRTVSNPGSYTTSPAMVGTSPLQPLRDFPRMSSSPGSGAGGLGMVGTGTGISRPLSRLRTESTASTTGGGGSPSSLGLGLPGSLHGNPLSPSSSTAPTPPTPTRSGTSISPISVKPFKAGSLAGYSGVGSVGGVGAGASLTSSGLATRPSPPTLNTNTTTNALAFPSSISAGGAGPAPVPVPSRKRYSSSFSHRYTSSLGGSGGSGGGGGGSGGGSAGTGVGVVGSVGAGAGGAGSVGSDKPRSKLSSPSSFHMAGDMDVDDDHDDISHFVREIDARKPLIGREKMMMEASSSRGGYHSRSRSVDVDEGGSRWRAEGSGLGRGGGLAGGGGSRGADETALVDDLPPLVGPRYEPRSPLGRRSSTSVTAQRASSPAAAQRQQREPRPGLLLATGTSPVLTSADEIDERLRKMNEAFLASLEGLGSTTTSAGGSGSGSSSPTTATATRRSTNTSMSSAGRTGSSSSARVMEREREFGTLGRGREYWQQRPTVGAGGAGGLGALFSGSPEASGTTDDVVAEEEEISTASTSNRPLPPPRAERRPSPFLGRLRDQYATGGGGDSGSSSEVAGLTGSGGSGSSMGIGLGRGGATLPPHLGLGQMGQGSGSEEVIGRMDMEAELDSQVFGKRSR